VVPILGELHIRSEKLFLNALRVGLEQNLAGVWSHFEKPEKRLKTKMPVSGDLKTFGS
jgi:hypothetical protein